MRIDRPAAASLVGARRRHMVAVVLSLLAATWLAAAPPTQAADGPSGSCLEAITLPCSASGGQTYDDVTLGASGNDDRSSVTAVLHHVVGDVTIRPLMTGVTADSGAADLTPDDVTRTQTFAWSYGDDSARLAYITVKAANAFAVFGVAGMSSGSIDVTQLLGGHDISHVGFWAIDASVAAPVRAKKLHGDNFVGNIRLARIDNGRVPCVHVETAELASCKFGRRSGAWLESASGNYAVFGQNITLSGKPGGDYIVAAQINRDGSVPALEPTGWDSSGTPYGQELAGSCMCETLLAATNVSGERLVNHATLDVCTSSNPHPDGAQLVRIDSTGAYCYSGEGAGLNDLNGTERDQYGIYYPEAKRCHVAWISGVEAPAAKRPATTSFPAPGKVRTDTPIVWRPVNNNLEIAN